MGSIQLLLMANMFCAVYVTVMMSGVISHHHMAIIGISDSISSHQPMKIVFADVLFQSVTKSLITLYTPHLVQRNKTIGSDMRI